MTRYEREQYRQMRAADRAILFVTKAKELAQYAQELDEKDLELVDEMVKRLRVASVTGELG